MRYLGRRCSERRRMGDSGKAGEKKARREKETATQTPAGGP